MEKVTYVGFSLLNAVLAAVCNYVKLIKRHMNEWMDLRPAAAMFDSIPHMTEESTDPPLLRIN